MHSDRTVVSDRSACRCWWLASTRRVLSSTRYVSALVANSTRSHAVDTSGVYWAWKASAIGKNSEDAKKFLKKRFVTRRLSAFCSSIRRYDPDMELEDAIHTAILTMKEGYDGEITPDNIELAIVGEDRKFRILSRDEVAEYVNVSE